MKIVSLNLFNEHELDYILYNYTIISKNTFIANIVFFAELLMGGFRH